MRLRFSEPDAVAPDERDFDIALQGKTVASNVDITPDSGGSNMAVVREFTNVLVGTNVGVVLTSRTGRSVLSGIEVVAKTE